MSPLFWWWALVESLLAAISLNIAAVCQTCTRFREILDRSRLQDCLISAIFLWCLISECLSWGLSTTSFFKASFVEDLLLFSWSLSCCTTKDLVSFSWQTATLTLSCMMSRHHDLCMVDSWTEMLTSSNVSFKLLAVTLNFSFVSTTLMRCAPGVVLGKCPLCSYSTKLSLLQRYCKIRLSFHFISLFN